MNASPSRRNFVANSGAAAAASLGFLIVKPESVSGSQANSALTVGLIGAGRRGTAISGIFAKNEFARIAAICDIYDDQLEAASKKFAGAK
ncbi:MAG: twin-arginine translocation signal domain-containing protein, partial [Bryobacterales bacterium]|nr:twin-arginine translocation signal domain-containing protein [Bryobacterales bacterium]